MGLAVFQTGWRGDVESVQAIVAQVSADIWS
jgi:hypothetical protein